VVFLCIYCDMVLWWWAVNSLLSILKFSRCAVIGRPSDGNATHPCDWSDGQCWSRACCQWSQEAFCCSLWRHGWTSSWPAECCQFYLFILILFIHSFIISYCGLIRLLQNTSVEKISDYYCVDTCVWFLI